MLTSSQPPLICPLTLMPFTSPRFLVEDGFTYEKSAIENWLKENPNKSPMTGKIPSATLLPNIALNRDLLCPITKEPFKEPYFCKEDCQTYEKEAILTWFETQMKKNIEAGVCASYSMRSPMNGIELESMTLYPNKTLFQDGGIPQQYEPTKVEISKFLSDMIPTKVTYQYIFDSEIRDMILQYTAKRFGDESLKDKIHERRKELALEVIESFYDVLDLSNLDLSNLTLRGLQQKGAILKNTNFANSTLIDCNFGQCRFLKCSLQKTVFINCNFNGEVVSFYCSDMKDAIIEPKSGFIEKGSTWQQIRDPVGFRSELKVRGALNTDTITFK